MTKQIKFKNQHLTLVGNLYLPENFDATKKYPTVIMVHPGGGVKEQTSAFYAQKLANNNFVALAYDASFQGESEGSPHFLEDPFWRVEDIRCAVDYLTSQSFIDAKKIAVIGVCAGAGYAINTAQTEHRIKAVVGISAMDIGAVYRMTMGAETLEAVALQRTAEANGAAIKYIPYVLETVDEKTDADMIEAHNYYYKDNKHPNSQNKMVFTSCDRIFAFTAFDQVETLLSQPLLLIAGSKAGTRGFSEELYNRETKTEKKELLIVDGATHINFYGNENYVNQAIEKVVAFFGENL